MKKQQAPADPKKGAWYLSLAASVAYLVIGAYDLARGDFAAASKDLTAAAAIGALPASWFRGWIVTIPDEQTQ